MRKSRIYVEQKLEAGNIIELRDSKAHYIQNVLRLAVGDPLTVFNGEGGEFEAQISNLKKRSINIQLLSYRTSNKDSPLTIELGLCLIKRDAMDFAIQKATELGVSRIFPLISDNTSISHKSISKRQHHWQEVAMSACEQCGLNIVPIVDASISYAAWLQRNADLKLIADLDAASNTLLGATQPESKPRTAMIAVGPEGGFSEQEVLAAKQAKFTGIYLGPRILRAETAVISMLSLLQASHGDLK